jgi:hypothetical protein
VDGAGDADSDVDQHVAEHGETDPNADQYVHKHVEASCDGDPAHGEPTNTSLTIGFGGRFDGRCPGFGRLDQVGL